MFNVPITRMFEIMIHVSQGMEGMARIEAIGLRMGFYMSICTVSASDEIFLREVVEHLIQNLWSQDYVPDGLIQ